MIPIFAVEICKTSSVPYAVTHTATAQICVTKNSVAHVETLNEIGPLSGQFCRSIPFSFICLTYDSHGSFKIVTLQYQLFRDGCSASPHYFSSSAPRYHSWSSLFGSLILASTSYLTPRMAFISSIPLRLHKSADPYATTRARVRRVCMTAQPSKSATSMDNVPPPQLRTQIYGPEEDVCVFGEDCILSEDCVTASPALEKLALKYVFPMREENTQVFFDNNSHPEHTVLIVFATDRHGLVLDVVSVLKALSVRVHRTASSENDALRVIFSRIEGELVSISELGLTMENCVAFWISDEESGDKIFDEGERLEQLTQCIKLELNTPYPRPRPAYEDRWSRVSVQKNRADRYTVFSLQTADCSGLLAEVTAAFNSLNIDVASASIHTYATRVENHFFVTKRGFKEPLTQEDIEAALDNVMRALLIVGDAEENETLWYQSRDGTALLVAEAIFIDEVNNRELACFKFSQFETPNFRGRLPEAPYCPILTS